MLATHLPVTTKRIDPLFTASLPPIEIADGAYIARFAQSPAELDAVLRLRFEVFNLELSEGFDASYRTQRDEDEFDAHCHHLIVIERVTGAVIGTYRMQSQEMAQTGQGFYSHGEFDLSALPASLLDHAVELGRACVAKQHRNSRVLFLLWRGLAAYLAHNHKRFLFGCCSLTSQDPAEGKRVMDYLVANGHLHPLVQVQPQPGFECYAPGLASGGFDGVQIPRLMKLYLTYGAKICGPPAIDRLFKTIDFLAMIDVCELDEKTFRFFFR